jgi:ligand-binding sensor domain-containing protein
MDKMKTKNNIILLALAGMLFLISCRDKCDSQGTPYSTVERIFCDSKGNIWFGTLGNGVARYDGKKFTTYLSELPNYHGYAGIGRMMEDKNGNIWIGNGEGVTCFDGKKFTNYTEKDGLPDNGVSGIAEDKEGNIWMDTWKGVVSFDGHTFTKHDPLYWPPNNNFWGMVCDDENRMWFGDWGNGLYCIDGDICKTYTTQQGLGDNSVSCITKDKKGNLWIGTSLGMSEIDAASLTSGKIHFTNFSDTVITNGTSCKMPNYNGRIDMSSIVEDKTGNLWLGTMAGAICYDGKSFRNFALSGPDTTVSVQCEAAGTDGKLWFLTSLTYKIIDPHWAEDSVNYNGNLKMKYWMNTEDVILVYDGKTRIRFKPEI